MPRPRSVTATVSFVQGRGAKPWLVQYRAIDVKTGKRRRFPEWYATENEARARKADIDAAVLRDAAKTPLAPSTASRPLTFREHYAEWLREVVSRRKPGTQTMYESNMRVHVLDLLGDVLVTPETMTSLAIMRVINARTAAGVSWAMQKNVIKGIRACLTWAVEWGRLTTNPALGLFAKMKDESYEEPQPNPLTREQAFAFLHWVRTNGRELPPGYRPRRAPNVVVKMRKKRPHGFTPNIAHWYPYFLLLFATGMRRNEGAGLQWPEVVLDDPELEPTIRIVAGFCPFARRRAQEGDRRYKVSGLQKPKTKASRRDLDALLPELVDVLRALALQRRADAFAQGREPSPFVILGSRGKPVRGRKTVDAVFTLGMAAIGATDEGHTVHDLRDTFATLHLMAKPGDLLRISQQLGHINPHVTLTRYAKWIPQQQGSRDFAMVLTRPDYGQPPAVEEGGESASPEKVVPLTPRAAREF